MTLTRYPIEQLYEEVAFVAYHFNWGHREVLDLPHWERRRWCAEISRINERMSDDGSGAGGVDARTLVASGPSGGTGPGDGHGRGFGVGGGP